MIAGYDTTATTLMATTFLLARNQDVQDKLYDAVIEKLQNFVGFSSIYTYNCHFKTNRPFYHCQSWTRIFKIEFLLYVG